MTRCSWAGCTLPAVTSEGGDSLGPWWHCATHLREHRALTAPPRLCATGCGEPVPPGRAKTCQDCRNARKHLRRLHPCGTRAAYERHRARSEQPCDPCRVAQAAYDRERHQRKRIA